MMQESRLTKIENCLTARQRVLVWLNRAQSCGGFLETLLSMAQSHLRPHALSDDLEALFLYYLAMECNSQIFVLAGYDPHDRQTKLLILVVLLQERLLLAHGVPDPMQARIFEQILLHYIEDAEILRAAIQRICEDHFAGHQVLFADAEKKLAERLKDTKAVLDGYNHLARSTGIKTLILSATEAAISIETSEKSQRMVSLARAQAYRESGYDAAADSTVISYVRRRNSKSKCAEDGTGDFLIKTQQAHASQAGLLAST
jgi:hypothetical protein